MKKLPIIFCINFAFTFIVLSFFLTCIYKNSTSESLFKQWCKKISTRESGWKGSPCGDLGAFSVFLKENLFKDDFQGHVLVMPSLNKIQLFNIFKPEFVSYYLFPVKIKIDNRYEFVLDEMAFKKLNKLPLITKMYDKRYYYDSLSRKYCLVQGVEANDYTNWAIYVFSTKEALNIFTLPIGWQGVKDSN